MELQEYAETRGAAAALAKALGVSTVTVSHWVNKVKRVPAAQCPAIERATAGAVRCEELRPDVAWEVLREPSHVAGPTSVHRRPGDVSAPEAPEPVKAEG